MTLEMEINARVQINVIFDLENTDVCWYVRSFNVPHKHEHLKKKNGGIKCI